MSIEKKTNNERTILKKLSIACIKFEHGATNPINHNCNITMKTQRNILAAFIIGSAIIWGAIIVGCSYALKGTGCYANIQHLLAGGFITHLILIWGPLAIKIKKEKQKQQ